MTKNTAKPRSPLRRLTRLLGAAVLVFFLAIGGTMFYSWRLANQTPEWWSPVNASDPKVDETARAVENGISNRLHQARPAPQGKAPEPFTLSIKSADANAWLAARLREWLANRSEKIQWPATASEPQVVFEDNLIRLGFDASDGTPGGAHRVVSVGLVPSVDDRGLWLQMKTFSIGRLNLPGSTVVDAGGSLLESKLPPEMRSNADTANFIGALSGSRPLTSDAVMKLSDGRKVRIVSIVARDGWLDVTCAPEPNK